MRASMSLLALGCACLAVVSIIIPEFITHAWQYEHICYCLLVESIGRPPAKQKDTASFAMIRTGAVRITSLRQGFYDTFCRWLTRRICSTRLCKV